VSLGCGGFEIHGGNRADLTGVGELLKVCQWWPEEEDRGQGEGEEGKEAHGDGDKVAATQVAAVGRAVREDGEQCHKDGRPSSWHAGVLRRATSAAWARRASGRGSSWRCAGSCPGCRRDRRVARHRTPTSRHSPRVERSGASYGSR
jgi:hypothetical protein